MKGTQKFRENDWVKIVSCAENYQLMKHLIGTVAKVMQVGRNINEESVYYVAGYWWEENDLRKIDIENRKPLFIQVNNSRIKLSSIVFYEVSPTDEEDKYVLLIKTFNTKYHNLLDKKTVEKLVEKLDSIFLTL